MLRLLGIILLLIIFAQFIGRLLLPYLLGRVVHNLHKKVSDDLNQPLPNEGKITINKNKGDDPNKGDDFIDYEEVK